MALGDVHMSTNQRRSPGFGPGVQHPLAKLDDSKVRAIRFLIDRRKARLPGSLTYQQIADAFGVSRPLIARFALGRGWEHIVEEPISRVEPNTYRHGFDLF